MRQRWWIGAVASLLLGFGAAVPALAQGAAGASAAIRVFQFQPGTLQVRAGTRVTWTNQDEITHTVISGVPGSPDGRFNVSLGGNAATGSATFPAPGAYPYFCARHPSMRGEVIVQELRGRLRAAGQPGGTPSAARSRRICSRWSR